MQVALSADDPTARNGSQQVIEDTYSLLPAQSGMVFNSLRAQTPGVDLIQITIDCPGLPDQAAWAAAWRLTVARHPVLRTAYRFTDGDEPCQDVYREVDTTIEWRTGEVTEAFLAADRARGFDVTVPPLWRITVLTRPSGGYTIVLSFHHAILDGRSLHTLLPELFADYAAVRAGEAAPDVSPPRPFRDFVAWWQKHDLTGSRGFWADLLRNHPAPGPLPEGRDTGPAGSSTIEVRMAATDAARLRDAAAQAGVTMATMVNAAWAVLLGRYRGTDDVVFGVTRSCRQGTADGAESMVGLLINTVPMRLRVPAGATVGDLLADAARQSRALRDHQLAPLGEIHRWSGLPATLPDTLVVFERQLLHTALVRIDPEFAERTITVHRQPSFPVTFYVFDEPEPRVIIIHDRRRLDTVGAHRMLHHVQQVLAALAGDPARRLADIPLADAAELDLLSRDWAGAVSSPAAATIPVRFAAQVASTPDAPAVVAGDTTLSYAQLDARTNQLAHLLRGHGVDVDTRVGVALPRGADLVVALLAVLKAGGAYLPIDPTLPPARIEALIADSGASVVVGSTGLIVPRTVTLLDPDTLAETLAGQPHSAPPCPAHPDSLAYLSYTSGSTGLPKGVAVPHRAVLRLASEPTFASFGPAETVLQLAPIAFDASTMELWATLLSGARLVVAPPGPLSVPDLAGLLREHRVTTLWLTAGLFHQVVELDVTALAGVRQLLAGGDVLAPDAVRAALAGRPGRVVVNGYGPTESTTFVACHPMTDPDSVGDRVPIGRPIQQTTAYVLDADLRPVPVGVPGELYAGGEGLARGYHGQPGLTAARFVPHPFSPVPGARLYRTGDLARWRADGVLEFLGRTDGQVKVRGFRVEPGEVESVLRGHPGVRDAVVVPRGDGETRHLLGYVVAPPGTSAEALREHAARLLPDYLVPHSIVVLDRLPLTPQGKVDRAALPAPDSTVDTLERPGRTPGSPVEVALAAIWSGILGVGQVGLDDGFFALGGNSLGATRLTFTIRDTFGVDLPVAALYDAPTLAGCAAAIEARGGTPRPAGSPAAARPSAPAPGGITRRDRSAFRSAAAATPPGPVLPEHLTTLAGDRWALWRWVCLRSAGFPFELHEGLASPALGSAADRFNAEGGDERQEGYDREFAVAERVLSRGLHAVAADPRFREAIAWQNRHALETGVDALLRRDPETVVRNGRYRKYEALVSSYLQRYCAKNDTIGFYGPVGWAEIRDGAPAVDLRPQPGGTLAKRTVYFEGWALSTFAESFAADLRPWLVPRRMPFVDLSTTVDGSVLRVPFAPAVPVTPLEAATFREVDGVRGALDVAAAVLAIPESGATDVEDVLRTLTDLRSARRIAWTLDIAPDDIWPERTVRRILTTVPDPERRRPVEAALDRLEAARDRIAASGATEVVDALTNLERTFTDLTGEAPTRRAGEIYAGRTLAFEECLRVDDVTFGPELLAPLRGPMELVLDAARWFTAAGAALFRRACIGVYRERVKATGNRVVPFAEFWLSANDLLFDAPDRFVAPVTRALQERWGAILDLPEGARRVELSSVDLRDKVRQAFAVARPGWPAAVQHSPDLMIAARDVEAIRSGDFLWVLGELHPGLNTVRYATWVAYHPSQERMGEAMVDDIGQPAVVLAPTGERGGTPARLSNVLVGPDDVQLVFAHDSSGYNPDKALFVGECDIEEVDGKLWVRRRRDGMTHELVDVIADPLSITLSQHFHVVPPSAHTPRVTIDRLVVQRETWRFPAAELGFAAIVDESRRFLAARRWVSANDLPRYVFVRVPGELKPIFVDLASLASVDLLSRAVRRGRRHGGDEAKVTVGEMMPNPEQLWLTDAEGRRYTSELRVCAVDRTGRQ